MVRKTRFLVVMALAAVTLIAPAAMAQGRFLDPGPMPPKHDPGVMERCRGAVTLVNDVGVEGRRATGWNLINVGGGGEGGRFDPAPVLTTRVTLQDGCLNAHFSAIVGSAKTYGGVAPVTLFQVSLSQLQPDGTWGPPQHMYGHWETPYTNYAPAVAIEAENDVDTISANFFQRVGPAEHDVPPGTYKVDVWWAGANGPGGAIGAAFVLKLYQQ